MDRKLLAQRQLFQNVPPCFAAEPRVCKTDLDFKPVGAGSVRPGVGFPGPAGLRQVRPIRPGTRQNGALSGPVLAPGISGRMSDVQGTPDTRYAKSGHVHIAYQVNGDGDRDLLVVPSFVSHLEAEWEEFAQ